MLTEMLQCINLAVAITRGKSRRKCSTIISRYACFSNAFLLWSSCWKVLAEHAVQQALYADTIVYGPNAWFVKVTLLLVVIRVFRINRAFVIFGYVFIAAMAAYYLPILILKVNICRPIRGFWNPSIASKCLDQRAMFVADTVVSAVTDLAVLLAPVPIIRALNMSFRQKAKVYVLLGAGGVATVASFIRMFLVIRLQVSKDQTVDFVRFNLLG